MTWRLRAAVVAACGVLAATALVSPAGAMIGEDEAPGIAPSPGPTAAVKDTCRMYASANGYGMVCTDKTGGSGSTSLVSKLNGKALKECWHDPAPVGYVGPPQDEPGTYYLKTCLRGLDRETLRRTGKLELDFEIVYITQAEVITLTPGEKDIIRYFFGAGQIPYPVLKVSPSTSPRVEQPVSFGLFAPTTTKALTTQGVTMYATVVQLKVDPGDRSGVIICKGPGRLLTAQQLEDEGERRADDVCSHSYERTSANAGAGRFRDRYPARVTASWQVRYVDASDPRGYRVIGTYEKTSVNQIRVTEIQTLVVS